MGGEAREPVACLGAARLSRNPLRQLVVSLGTHPRRAFPETPTVILNEHRNSWK